MLIVGAHYAVAVLVVQLEPEGVAAEPGAGLAGTVQLNHYSAHPVRLESQIQSVVAPAGVSGHIEVRDVLVAQGALTPVIPFPFIDNTVESRLLEKARDLPVISDDRIGILSVYDTVPIRIGIVGVAWEIQSRDIFLKIAEPVAVRIALRRI